MAQYRREIQVCRCFHYSAGLPVRLITGSRVMFSMPEKITTAVDVTGDESISSELQLMVFESDTEIHDSHSPVRYAANQVGENYIILHAAPELSVSVGPFLAEPATSSYITGLVRSGVLKLHDKAPMQEYLDSLPVLTSKQFYYLGKLLEMLFLPDGVSIPELSVSEPAKKNDTERDLSAGTQIPDSYFIRSQDYRSELFLHSPYMVEQEICHFISAGDTDGALRVLSEINSRPRAQLAKNTVRSLKNSMICSCAFMARAAISGGVSADEAFTLSDAYIQDIESANDIRRILAYETEMVKGYTAAVKSLAGKGLSRTVSQAIDYVNSHLCEELSVGMIADAVFLNPNYLSGLFAKETGETIHSFIIRRRIEEAGFFVRNTAESFADIASFYRFCSQSHFTRCFREIMGTTPGKYRNGN